MHFIFREGFWVVIIPSVYMVNFKLLAQFPMDHFSHPVMSSLIIPLRKFIKFAHYVINRFVSITTYVVYSISFQTFFVQAFKIVVDSWKFTMLQLYILWDDRPIFMISGSNQHLQQQLEYTLLKTDCDRWWISKMRSGREDSLEERYTIKFCFKLGKNTTETYGMLQTAFGASCMNRASGFEWHKGFKEGRESVEMMRGVGGVRKSEHQSWLVKGLGLGLLCWGFKGVLEEIPTEDASTLQIGSVAFPAGQCTNPQLHPFHRLFDQDGNQHSSSPSL